MGIRLMNALSLKIKTLVALVWIAAFCVVDVHAAATPDKQIGLEKASTSYHEDTSYQIGPQNLLQIKVLGESTVNQIYRVEDDGFIKHALLGRVRVGGMSVPELEKYLEEHLDGDYIINPKVTVFILEFSSFSILGEVKKPGNYELSGRVSLIHALSIAGGFTPVASQKNVQIMRKNQDGTETKLTVDTTRITQGGDLSVDEDLQPDDIIVVSKSFF